MATALGDDGVLPRAGRGDALARWIARHPLTSLLIAIAVIFVLWLVLAPWPAGFEDVFGRKRLFINALFNGITLGALVIGLSEQFGLVYFQNYATVSTFLIMVVVLALRPQGLLGKR